MRGKANQTKSVPIRSISVVIIFRAQLAPIASSVLPSKKRLKKDASHSLFTTAFFVTTAHIMTSDAIECKIIILQGGRRRWSPSFLPRMQDCGGKSNGTDGKAASVEPKTNRAAYAKGLISFHPLALGCGTCRETRARAGRTVSSIIVRKQAMREMRKAGQAPNS